MAVALWFVAGASHAGFVDNRKADAVIEVNYKSIAVEDLLADIVPPNFQAIYSRAALRKSELTVSGKGTWQQLLSNATSSTAVIVTVDLAGQRIHISDRAQSAVPLAQGASPSPSKPTSALQDKPAVAKPTQPAPAPLPPDKLKRDWVLRVDAHNTLEDALEEFAARVDYELVYEAREFTLNLKRDITIARGADFWEALRVLGETYRKSDGAFQVLPTDFKQIVILPMGQNTAAAH
jgi:hypothetical protein